MLRSLLLSSMLLACGSSPEDSSVQTVVGKNDLQFLSLRAVSGDNNAASMGTLVTLVSFDGEVYGTPYCSAVRISRRHILSAAHCYTEGEPLAFDNSYLAREEDREAFRFEKLGKLTRLSFLGLPIDAYLTQKRSLADALPAPALVDRLHDFVIWELPEETNASHIAWNDLGNQTEDLALYSYPQGAPLAKAESCTGVWQRGVLRHDCDSLSGSSGGLITDKDGRSLALHTTGAADNLWSVFESRGEFETLAELAARIETKSATIQAWECEGTTDGEAKQDCIVSGGRNRALGLQWIRDTLSETHPGLAAAIKKSATHKGAEDRPCDQNQKQAQSVATEFRSTSEEKE